MSILSASRHGGEYSFAWSPAFDWNDQSQTHRVACYGKGDASNPTDNANNVFHYCLDRITNTHTLHSIVVKLCWQCSCTHKQTKCKIGHANNDCMFNEYVYNWAEHIFLEMHNDIEVFERWLPSAFIRCLLISLPQALLEDLPNYALLAIFWTSTMLIIYSNKAIRTHSTANSSIAVRLLCRLLHRLHEKCSSAFTISCIRIYNHSII